MDLFSEGMRRNPYPAYDRMRSASPVFHLPPFDLWMLLDFEGVRRALVEHGVFSSDLSHVPGHGNPGGEWFLFDLWMLLEFSGRASGPSRNARQSTPRASGAQALLLAWVRGRHDTGASLPVMQPGPSKAAALGYELVPKPPAPPEPTASPPHPVEPQPRPQARR